MEDTSPDPLQKRRTFPRGTPTTDLRVRVSQDEHERLKLRARASGVPVTEYLAACGLVHHGGMTSHDARALGYKLLDLASELSRIRLALTNLPEGSLSLPERLTVAAELHRLRRLQAKVEDTVDKVVPQ